MNVTFLLSRIPDFVISYVGLIDFGEKCKPRGYFTGAIHYVPKIMGSDPS